MRASRHSSARTQPLDATVNWNPNGYEWTVTKKTPR